MGLAVIRFNSPQHFYP